jgi:hypothetical protein
MLRPVFSEPMSIDGNGDRVSYRDAETGWLLDRVYDTDSTDGFKLYAVHGLMRALLDTEGWERNEKIEEFLPSVNWASGAMLDLLSSREPEDPSREVVGYLAGLPEVSGIFDGTTIHATAANDPKLSTAVIERHIPKDTPKLVVGLGHGGIVSSMVTYGQLEGDNAFYPVRYSRRKRRDMYPALAEGEVAHLRDLAKDRVVIVHDEDWSSGTTVDMAMLHLDEVLHTETLGYVPVESVQEYVSHPAVFTRDRDTEKLHIDDYYGSRLNEVREEAGLR